jgi:uncharacterized lipoprotein YmbA
MVVSLPQALSEKLEQFKKAKGKTWAKELEQMLEEALLEAQAFAPGGRALSDEEAEQLAVAAVKTYRKK